MSTNGKTLIFDLGGVLLDIYIDRAFGALAAIGLDSRLLNEENALIDEVIQRYDCGTISTSDFYDYIARHLPQNVRELPQEELFQRIDEIWNMIIGNFDIRKIKRIDELRSNGYRVVLLSNTNERHWEEIERLFLRTTGIDINDFFDELYLSFRMKLRKPDKEIFLKLLSNENTKASDCVFIDDSAQNCQSAESVGIKAINVARNAAWGE